MGGNVFVHLNAAARGDLSAQRALADAAVQQIADREEPPFPTIDEGLIFARMAASHGELADKGRLLAMLRLAVELCGDTQLCPQCTAEAFCEPCRWAFLGREEYHAEALAVASMLADEGVTAAEHELPAIVAEASPLAAFLAKDLEARMRAALETNKCD
jgi:hypothetical protein